MHWPINGVVVGPEQQMIAWPDNQAIGVDEVLRGVAEIVSEVHARNINVRTAAVVELNPVILVTLRVGHGRGIIRHELVDDQVAGVGGGKDKWCGAR